MNLLKNCPRAFEAFEGSQLIKLIPLYSKGWTVFLGKGRKVVTIPERFRTVPQSKRNGKNA